jgi:N-acetylmuramoyl-L-alanine amidase/type II secretory pathway predicted ATPase ExeA
LFGNSTWCGIRPFGAVVAIIAADEELKVKSMLLDFFQLREQPFGVTPDPAYLYPTQTHCEALDCLTEGILEGRGFLALIAEPGMGKTTLLYQVLEGLRDTAVAAYLFQTQCNSREFFQYLLSELGVDSSGMGMVAMHNKLNEMLFAQLIAGKRFVLIVDEAQNLDDSVLETIRLLSNFETSNTKLLQIVLAGQPQLAEKLGKKELEQLLQRVTTLKRLETLTPEETAGYIKHRLKVAGHHGEELFEPESLARIAELSRGIPRIINKICFQALSEAYAESRRSISPYIVVKASRKLGLAKQDRKLGTITASQPTPTLVDEIPTEQTGITPEPGLTYKRVAKSGSRGWGLLAGVFLAAVLSAAVVSPGNLVRQMMQTVHDQVTTMGSAVIASRNARANSTELSSVAGPRAEGIALHRSLELRESQTNSNGVVAHREGTGTSNISSIQATNSQGEARVVVMLDDELQYHSARISSPDRIYFDLYNAHLGPSVGQKTVPNEDGLLKWVRTGQNAGDVVRLVLDADGARDYSARLLSNPNRLVIEVYGQLTGPAKRGLGAEDALRDLGQPQLNASTSPEGRISLPRQLGLKISRIAIDPGHGGSDTGTVGPRGLLEKNLCLDVALRLGHLIEENIPDAEVIYTRKDDSHVPLEERAAIANRANADLFISIHANSSDIREARGVETYYLSLGASPGSIALTKRENALALSSVHDLPELIKKITRSENTAESRQLALDIQGSLSQRLQLVSRLETNRGVKQAPFVVLTGANMPAVLSEISFVSNPSDESLLLENGQRQRVAEGLFRGVTVYLESLHSLPHRKENLFSEIRPGGASGFANALADVNSR